MAVSDKKNLDQRKIEVLIAKLRETLLDLKQNLCNLHHKIEIIDSKLELQSSIKNYRNDI